LEIKQILENKEKYIDLLLLGDESESLIKDYLKNGDLFALFDNDLKTVCVVIRIDEKTYEVKNIATYEKYKKNGYGSNILKYLIDYYKNKCKTLLVGTGDIEWILSFYKNVGFHYSHKKEDFFIKNYDHEMYENGIQLKDMIYLKIEF
jgi:GNAT superfamily N-acetyltransferase